MGGCVRDGIMGIPCGDIDIEVHGIEKEKLEKILDSLGQVLETGKSFGIYRLAGFDIDIALPRRERQTGVRHTDFDVEVDCFIGTKKSASRRDFTVNSLLCDILTGEITDHFGGIDDIKNKILRHTNEETFPEDSLRVFRCAMFASRLGFEVAPETLGLCRKIDVSHLSPERVNGEVKKSLLLSEKPSVFFETLRKMDKLSVWFPELEKLIGVKQNPVYHPEGDVWTHTMLVLDRAAEVRDNSSSPYGFMLASLTHDFGKALTTQCINGVIHSYGHEKAGIPLVQSFVKRLTNEKKLLRYAENMVGLHMKPNVTAREGSSVKATNRMFGESVDPPSLIYFSYCDSGKSDNIPFLRERYGIFLEYMSRPYVTGRDLIEAGMKEGKEFSASLELAYKLRLAGVPKADALKQILGEYGRK